MLEDYQEIVSIVQSKFLQKEIVKSIHLNVKADDSFDDSHRILALLQYRDYYALIVLISEKEKPSSISDLSIETAVPIDEHFSCDTKPIKEKLSHLKFIIKYQDYKLNFVLAIGKESSEFASEVIKAKEVCAKYTDNSWLCKYKGLRMSNFNKCADIFEEQGDIPLHNRKFVDGNAARNRESLINYYLMKRESEYIKKQEFSIFTGTFNVNGQAPPKSLKCWLSYDNEPPDIYAVGFQEIDLSKEAFIFNETPRETEWVNLVKNGVHPDAKYRKVEAVRLVGMLLIVLIKNEHYGNISQIESGSVGTGLLGIMGNKGGVAIRFKLHNTFFCFVNSHLAAFESEFERRNQDYKDINARLNFKSSPNSINGHDQVYWLGDLNYRISNLSASAIKASLNREDISNLLLKDQLNVQRQLKNVLADYQEGDITFIPTYKYDLNTDNFDTEKLRPPAWTDRILWKGEDIYINCYRSHMEVQMSDHKPVSATFKSQVKIIDPTRHRKVQEDVLKSMDKYENEILPQVAVDRFEVVYDKVIKFRELQCQEITIANTGTVPVEFEFINKLDEDSYCKEWLRITPSCNTIIPGEKCDVKFEVLLESGIDKVEDILILHLKNGKDMFITINGTCQKSCFTCDMEDLCRMNVPVLHVQQEQWDKIVKKEVPLLYSVPRELWLMIDFLYRNGLKTKDLFVGSALPGEFSRIRDWLDYGSQDPIPGTVKAVAESLLLFLQYTKTPVIPFELQEECIAAANNYQNSRQVLMHKVPDINRTVFLYVCLFLQEFLKYSHQNGHDAKTLASLFGEILLRDRIRSSKLHANRGKANFVYNFLQNDLSSSLVPK